VERRSFQSSIVACAAPFAALAIGCSAPVGDLPDAGSTQRLALLEVRAEHAVVDGSLTRLDASARFVSVREPGLTADALHLLGLAWPSVPAGTCTAVTGEVARPAAAVRVDLRDLSPVSLDLLGDDGVPSPLNLEPRAFPDVAGLVSGVVFVRPSSAPAIASPRRVALAAAGSPATSFDLPEVPAVRLVDALESDEGSFTVSSRGLELASARPREGERVVVDVVRAGVVRSQCAVDGAGRLRIDASALGGAGEATLVVRAQRRLQREDAQLGVVEARLERAVEVHARVAR
jgi:hypothetical protein